jgi:hypothetical protein
MATKRLKRPRDPIALAKMIGDIATGAAKRSFRTLPPSPVCNNLRSVGAWGIRLEYNYEVHYRNPRTGTAGFMILPSSARANGEKTRLEALGYVVMSVVPPSKEKAPLLRG